MADKSFFGTGACEMHAGELIQGATSLENWPHTKAISRSATPRVFVLTHPMPIHGSSTRFELRLDARDVDVTPKNRGKAKKAAELALRYLGLSCGGDLYVHNTFDRLDVPNLGAGWGCGSSTSDVVASIFAVRNAVDSMISSPSGPPIWVDLMSLHKLKKPNIVSTLVYQAEGPCDALAFLPHPVYWFSRNGRILGPLVSGSSAEPSDDSFSIFRSLTPKQLHERDLTELRFQQLCYPRMRSVTFCIDHRGVDTSGVQLLDAYTNIEIDTYNDMIAESYEAIIRSDHVTLGKIALQSASMQRQVLIRTQNYPPSLYLEDFLWEWLNQTMKQTSAIGLSISHSGTMVSLLFGPEQHDEQSTAAEIVREFGFKPVWQYSFGGDSTKQREGHTGKKKK